MTPGPVTSKFQWTRTGDLITFGHTGRDGSYRSAGSLTGDEVTELSAAFSDGTRYVEQVVDDNFTHANPDLIDLLRDHMQRQLATEVIDNDSVMLTLPHATTRHIDRPVPATVIRLSVPVRKITRTTAPDPANT